MTDSITAILFCGGKGSRLYPISEYYQKTMMPIGSRGIPALEMIIQHLKFYGVKKFVALIGYRANQVRSYFGDGSEYGISIDYITDDPHMKGTGGALLNARDYIDSQQLLLYYTDVLSNLNLSKMFEFHQNHSRLGSIFVDPNWKLSNLIVKKDVNDRVTETTLQPEGIFVNTSICLMDRKIIEILGEYYQNHGKVNQIDLSSDIFPLLAQEKQLLAYISDDWWFDIGSLKKYQQLDGKFISSKFSHLDVKV